ncbi:hypothetical protein BDQ12DRAFT_89241 [Crucibulum laeve]|uniref:Uncharacterized protein n=1 Tax=Crucibulum laeve TaxID=68775 RepID=A0A5C3M2T1_9AGAR|nr:hypothetical protein BDQ12DRAFT_89241 [Crucibulum laeve]
MKVDPVFFKRWFGAEPQDIGHFNAENWANIVIYVADWKQMPGLVKLTQNYLIKGDPSYQYACCSMCSEVIIETNSGDSESEFSLVLSFLHTSYECFVMQSYVPIDSQ